MKSKLFQEETPVKKSWGVWSMQISVVTLVLVALDWLLQQLGVLSITIVTHALVVIVAFYSAKAVWCYHNQNVIPGLVELTRRLGHQPDVIGPYNVFTYIATTWLFVAVGYGVHTAMLLGLIH